MWLWMYFKRLLKTPVFVFILVIFPIFSYLTAELEKNSTEKNTIGLFFEDDEYSEAVTQKLKEASSFFDYKSYGSEAAMKSDIINGTLHCGYVFGRIMDAEENKLERGSVKCIKTENSTLTGIANEAVFSALQALYGYAPELKYAKDHGFAEMSADNMRKKYFFYSTSDLTYSFIYEMIGGEYSKKVESNADANSSFPVRAAGAMFVMLASLFGAVRFRMDEENGIHKRLSPEGAFLASLLNVFSIVLPAAVSAFAAILLSGTHNPLSREAFAMLIYMAIATLFGCLLANTLRSVSHSAALAPILIIGTLIFCPVFVNAENYVPFAGVVNKFFIPYYYFCIFGKGGILWSITAFAVLGILSLSVFVRKCS